MSEQTEVSAKRKSYIYRVNQKDLNGFARPNLRIPWDYRNGMGAKRCVLSISFLSGNVKILIILIF
jgi:hypothetical protein